MILIPKDSETVPDNHQVGRILVDESGENGPVVVLEDGTVVGPLLDVLGRFGIAEPVEEEMALLEVAERSRYLVHQSGRLCEEARQADQTIWRMLSRCEDFLREAEAAGFSVPPMPGIPGEYWRPTIQTRRWSAIGPDQRDRIVRGLLTLIDWRQKDRAWNFDPVAATIVDAEGRTIGRVQLRDGYMGPVA